MRRLLIMIEGWGVMFRKSLPTKRDDRVDADTLRSDSAVKRANEVIRQIENETVLERRVRLMERRRKDDMTL